MERIWSYLRRFSRMSKEMRPSHRIDVLSGAIEYYILLKKKGLGKFPHQGFHAGFYWGRENFECKNLNYFLFDSSHFCLQS